MSDIGITITFDKRESKCIINVVMSSDGICGIQLTAYKTKYHTKSSKILEKKRNLGENYCPLMVSKANRFLNPQSLVSLSTNIFHGT